MDKKVQFSIWYVIIAFILMLILQSFLAKPQVEVVPYSKFLKMVENGKISSVEIGDQRIIGYEKAATKGERPKTYIAIRVPDDKLVDTLKKYNVTFYGKYENPWVKGFLLSWVLPLLILYLIWMVIFKKVGKSFDAGVMSFGKSKAKLYAENETGVTFNDVAGEDEAKEELKEVVDFLKNPDRYSRLGARLPKGVLLVGPPGTGKTLLARAVAGEAGVPFFSMSGSDFVEMFVGVGAARVRDLFRQAQEKAPCIIFIDELDALGKARGITPYSNDEREQTLNQLLTEMDGFNTSKGIVIIGATNRPEILDPALLRPGRFDRQILVDRPDLNGRYEILKVHTRNVKLAQEVDLKKIAAATPGFVGADLANIVNEALLLAIRKGRDEVRMEDFDEAIERVVAGLEKKNRLINRKEKERVAYHEVGHAIVGALLTDEPVHKISIIPRGIGALGYTLQLPTEDRYLMTRTELLNKISVLLGGRAAEEVFFGDISTGAQNDLEKATDTARKMVTMYGMSEKVGLATLEKPGQQFLNVQGQMDFYKNYSPETAALIDAEVKRILEETYEKVKKLVEKNKDKIEKIAEELLKREVLDEKSFQNLLVELKLLPEKTEKSKVEEK
ncbi:MAG: cell division protein FtsH [Spirochaetes bacterium]|nr:MAG: cell division protein FtsH [Spirochaetota bacterium]